MSKYEIVIKSTSMGAGEKELSENLLKGFIHTLTTKETLPEHIIFYGEGVKLAAKGSQVLADLKDLKEKGVEILSCGICLDYYELDEYLEVGRVTTMGEVVDILYSGNIIIEP